MGRSAALMVALVTVCVCLPGLAEDGVLNLGPEEFIQAGGVDIAVPGYSVPSFEDWNNDGLRDLIVGEGGNGFTGKVRVYLNVGVESDPCFVNYFYVQAAGADLTIPPAGCLGAFPRVVYWDDDNRKDLLIGQADGTVKIFLNVTDNNEPAFDAGTLVKVGVEDSLTLDVGMRATPSLVHWNDDGMLDLVVGGLDGVIHVYLNCGCGGWIPPHFYFSSADGYPFAQSGGRDLTVPGGRSSPVFADLDGDGKKDLLTGNTEGMIFFYKNIGTVSLPEFANYTLVQSAGVAIDLPNGASGGLRSRPFVCNWTGDGKFGPKDGYWDMLVGYGDGKIRLYRGLPKAGDFDFDGDLDGADFTFLAKALDKPVPTQGPSPDLNADGVVDNLDLRVFADLWLATNK
jgi:hypothetical protein